MQLDAGEQAQPSHGVVAGEDARLRIANYPMDQQAVDLCIDARVSLSRLPANFAQQT